ncbi:MAG: hypothetical protein F6J98_02245 [Moorea sp. SIO4G2]|nr:hypothetical protein [Moorena sp. SIO4G2]
MQTDALCLREPGSMLRVPTFAYARMIFPALYVKLPILAADSGLAIAP